MILCILVYGNFTLKIVKLQNLSVISIQYICWFLSEVHKGFYILGLMPGGSKLHKLLVVPSSCLMTKR